MMAAALLLNAAISLAIAMGTARLSHRQFTSRDGLAGPGVAALIWIFAFLAFEQPGLAVQFDGFRFLSMTAATTTACLLTALFRLRRMLFPAKLYHLGTAVLLVFAALWAEIFLFNSSYFVTHSYQPVDLAAYCATQNVHSGTPYQLNEEQNTLTFEEIDQPIYNLQLEGLTFLYDGEYPQDQNPLMILQISGTDEASSAARQSWRWEAAQRSPRSQYRTLHFSGAVSTLTLEAEGYQGEYRQYPLTYTVDRIVANTPRPMEFSWVRMLLCCILLLAVWALRPAGSAWRESYLADKRKYRPAVITTVLLLGIAATLAPFADARNSGIATSFYNVENWDGVSRITFTQHISDWQNDSAAQYGSLAHSLLNGRLDLERDPPESMLEMENPYDTAARAEQAPDALWDVAYFEGRYYVYFGIVPCLLFQLPFEWLTGVPDLPPSIGMIVMAWLMIFAAFGLMNQAVRRWFPGASAAAYLLASTGLVAGSQIYYLLLRPSVYEYAILCGASFVMLGLWQWLCAANLPDRNGVRICLHLALGSLCMALVAGCRPQMEVFAVLCLPIFWPRYVGGGRLKRAAGHRELLAFAVPVLVVAAGLMAYNAARFGSAFDFGANYNLTSNDMTRRGFSAGRIAPALFTYFLSLPVVQAVFPYLTGSKMLTNYVGMTITEIGYGGVFASLPVSWSLAALPVVRGRLSRRRDLRAMIILPFLLAVLLAVVDCEMAGVLYRYLSDFLAPLLFAAMLLWLCGETALAEHRDAFAGMQRLEQGFREAFCMAVGVTAWYTACVYFAAEPGLLGQNPALYQTVSRLVQFWL